MVRYLFTSDGYRCVDVDGSILHQSDKHEDLFQFIDKDESPVYDMLREYLVSCVDIKEFRPVQNENKHKLYFEMRMLISELHPFCTAAYLDREIANYFNDRLASFCIESAAEKATLKMVEVSESQYKAMFDALFPHEYGFHSDMDSDSDFQHLLFYAHFRRILNAEETYNDQDKPFSDLQRAKLLIKDYLYWVLDDQATSFSNLTFPQRLYVYNEYHHLETFKVASTNVEYYWGSEAGIRFDGPHRGLRNEVPLTVELPDGRYMADAVQGIASNECFENMDANAKKLLSRTMSKAKKSVKFNEYCAVYGVEDLFTLLFIECQRMYEAKMSIRRCERCGRYFNASKRIYKYCERLIDDESGLTCRDVGAKETAKKKITDDPIYYLYNKAYRTHHARIRAGRLTKHEFDAWTTEAKRRMSAAIENPALQDEYAEWLKL